MQITSNRFGLMNIQPTDIIQMPNGLIGFESSCQWVLLSNPQNTSVAWLQSVTQAHVAVPVVSPRRHNPNYRVHVSQRDLGVLKLRPNDSIYVLSIVSRNNGILTANLKSPILLNSTRQIAVQVVTTDAQVLAMPIGNVSATQQTSAPTSTTRKRQAA